MNTTFLALNASYSHTSLAARYLRAASYEAGYAVSLVEMTVNERPEAVSRAIYDTCPDVLCCSVYIWNVRIMIDVCTRMKLLLPKLHIVWGGPEVVGDEMALRESYPLVDTFCSGEGETVLPVMLKNLSIGAFFGGMLEGEPVEMDSLPAPYSLDDDLDGNRLYYFETSRGCLYNCAYCISSRENGVRYLSEQVALQYLEALSRKVPLIKFVDRTFNADRARARRLWEQLLELPGDCRFHFEICAHLLTEEDFALLSKPKARRLQFEIGLQSASLLALSAVNRNMDPAQVLENVRKLRELGTVEVHLDLIAGLPGEGYAEFLSSVDRAMESRPHRLHLGFLKLLPGTEMREKAEQYQIRYLPYAPYEVLATKDMTAGEMLMLKDLEHAIDRYSNTRRFVFTITALLNSLSATVLFGRLAAKEYRDQDRVLYEIGLDSDMPEALLRELLLLDFLLREPHRAPPAWMMAEDDEATLLREIVYGPGEKLYAALPHREGTRPGLVLRDLRLCVLSVEGLRHLGFAEISRALLIDHGRPVSARIFPVGP